MPAVSVVVPNYNHARFLRQRIDSILNQTFQDFELILLDDCSTDNSRSILSSYASDPRVRLDFNETNSGTPFKQWNKGVRLANGKYVWIAESDDYADQRLIEDLIHLLNIESRTVYAYCRSWRVSQNGELEGYADHYLSHLDEFNAQRWTMDYRADGVEECRNYFFRANLVPNASAVLFRKNVFEQVGGADESLRLCGDWKLWASMALTGEVAYLGKPLNYFRFHDASMRSKIRLTKENIAETLQVLSWLLQRVTPPKAVMRKVLRWQADQAVPMLMSTKISKAIKLSVLRSVREIDPHPLRHAVVPALRTVRLKLLRHCHDLARSVRTRFRELWAWRTSQTPQFPTVAQMTASIAALSALEAPSAAEPDSEAPIFLFSTGMRTGSTLLQRILVTDSRLLLWGEPMGEMDIAGRITQMVGDCMNPAFRDSWQRQPELDSSQLVKSWIALLHPSTDNFRLGLRNFFGTWLGRPARRSGFTRWGFKEVRLDATAAVLLHWLYPSAKFILLTRHPFDCYRSFADAGWKIPNFVRYPDSRVDSAASLAREWNRIALSWPQLPAGFPSRLIKYEDLTSGNFDFRGLESWLGLKLNESEALSEKVGRTAFRARLHAYERWIVSREAAPGMRALGYSSHPVAPAKPISVQQPECAIPDQKSA